MRHEMVLQKEGEMEFSLLTHSDDMKRVSTRTQRFVDIQQQNQLLGMLSPTSHSQMHSTCITYCYVLTVSILFNRYFYGPIDGTPFTLAIALPDKYGMYELNSQEEIRHSHQNGK